jgi:hypothetical protein
MPHKEFAKSNKLYSQYGNKYEMLMRQYEALESQHAVPAPAPASPYVVAPGDPGTYVPPTTATAPIKAVQDEIDAQAAGQKVADAQAAQQAADAQAAQQAAQLAQQAADAQAKADAQAAQLAQQAADAQAKADADAQRLINEQTAQQDAETQRIIDEMLRKDAERIKAEQAASTVVTDTGTGVDTMAPQWEDWGSVFGEYTPKTQYEAMMQQYLPQYGMPGYASLAGRQFAPTLGRYLMQGYGDTDAGTTGLGAGTGFADWFKGSYPGTTGGTTAAPTFAPSPGLGGVGAFTGQAGLPGWNIAQQFAGMSPTDDAYAKLETQNPGMAYAIKQEDAIKAMAMAKYYQGGGPTGGYAGRAVASTMGNLYNRWMNQQIQSEAGATAPAGFLPYLSGLNPNVWTGYQA